jgi:hypothetical protein
MPQRSGSQATALVRADPRTRAAIVARLQRTRGNDYVQRLVAASRRAGDDVGQDRIQRCGAIPCGCSAGERVAHAVDRLVLRDTASIQRDEADDEQQTAGGGSLFDSVTETISGAVGSVSEGVGQVTGAVSDGVGQVAEAAPEAISEAGGAITSGVESVQQGASQLVGGAVASVSEGIGAVGEAVGGIGSAIAEGASGLFGGLGGDGDGGTAGVPAVASDVAKTTSDNETLTSCEPFEDPARAAEVRFKLGFALPAAAGALFGSGVAKLWIDYIGGGSGLQVLNNDPTIVEAFATSSTTIAAADQIADAVREQVEADKTLPDGIHQLDDEKILRRGRRNAIANTMTFTNPFSIPGHIAGGIATDQGGSDVGARPSQIDDDRSLGGTAEVKTQGNGTRIVTVRPKFTVVDTVDLCPGNKGAALELALTVPLSKLEAGGLVGDVPFRVTFGTEPVTRVAGAPPDGVVGTLIKVLVGGLR